ncbi:MAG: GGDEF domain-containing protein [Desulfovibrio sp.]|nr:GGDEF domain-containing protein [Desulfovibrio sp.]
MRRFTAEIRAEIARITRGCAELSLICAELVDRGKLAATLGAEGLAALENALVATLRRNMQECDSLGRIAEGRHALLLPGVGPNAARMRGERLQSSFTDKTRTKEPRVVCALGLVSISRGEVGSADDLLERGNRALNDALKQKRDHISQDRLALSERPTLVHSDEKRFLFFGEEQT